MLDAGNRRTSRHDAGCQDHLIEASQIVCSRASVELDDHAELLKSIAEVAQGLGEFLFPWNAPREIELTADLSRCLEQGHRVTALRGGDC